MPSSSQGFNAQPDASRRSNPSASTRSGNEERFKKSKKPKVQSEDTRGTDSAKIHSTRPIYSSPSLHNHEEPKNKKSYPEPKPRTNATQRSRSIVIPETPKKGGELLEVETEQREETEEDDATGVSVGPGREFSMSLGNASSPATHHQGRGVSRLHLAREVKILPTIEHTSSHPRSSRESSTITVSQTSSEYLPTSDSPLGTESSSTSTTSIELGAQISPRDTTGVEPTSTQAETTLGKLSLSDLDLPDGLLRLPLDDPQVYRFKGLLSFQYRCTRLQTMGPLKAIRDTRDAQEFHMLRDQIATGYSQMSCIIKRYRTLAHARLIQVNNRTFRRVRSLHRNCKDRLADPAPISVGPGTLLEGGNDAPRTQTFDNEAPQLAETTGPPSSRWKGKARAYPECGSHASVLDRTDHGPNSNHKLPPFCQAHGPSVSHNNLNHSNWMNNHYRPRYSQGQNTDSQDHRLGIEVRIPRRKPDSGHQRIQNQADWDHRYRREITAGRIGGPYHTNPPPTPAAEKTTSDRMMSVIPPDEFYRRPLEIGSSVSDKPRHEPQTFTMPKFPVREGKNPNSTPQAKHDSSGTGNTADHKESLASSSNQSHSSRQSQLALLDSTDHCNESKKMKSKHKRHTSGASQDISGHQKKRKKSVSHSATSGITASPLDRPSKPNKIKRRNQEVVPSNVSTGSESNKSPKTSISSSHARPSGCDSNLGIAGRASVTEKPDRNSCYKVNIERQSPESGELSVHTTPGSSDRPQKHSRDEPSTTPSPPKKRSRKACSGHAKSPRRHDVGALRDSTPLSEISLIQTPASGTRSKKCRKDEHLATSSSPEKRRMTSQVHAESSCGNTADHQIFAEEVESSVTPTPGPSTQSKGKGRVLTRSSSEGEDTHSGGIDDRGHDALEHLSPNIQRSKCRTLPTVPAFHRSRFLGRDTPWLEERVERKVKEILEKQHMPPPPNPLRARPQNQPPSDVPGGQGLNDEQLVAIAKNKDLSGIVRFARAPDVFAQNGSFRAKYYYLRDTLTEEDWQRVAPRQKYRAPRPQADI